MKVIMIEGKAFEQMQQALEKLLMEIEKACKSPAIEKEWLDNQDVCMLLNIKPRTLQHYRDYGTIPFSMIGHKCYYKASDVEMLIKKSKKG